MPGMLNNREHNRYNYYGDTLIIHMRKTRVETPRVHKYLAAAARSELMPHIGITFDIRH